MNLMETPPGMENVRVRFASVVGRAKVILRAKLSWCSLRVGTRLIAQDETGILFNPYDFMFSVITVGVQECNKVLKISFLYF